MKIIDLSYHFTKPELTALLSHMCDDYTREGMYGLALDGARVYATDGHRAVMLTTGDVSGEIASGLVPRGLLEQAMKIAKAKSAITISLDAARVKISVDGTTMEGPLSTSRPPPVDRVFPNIEPGHTGTVQRFNGWYLKDIGGICDACPPTEQMRHGKKEKLYSSVVMYPGKQELDPLLAVVECSANQCTWKTVLMPCAM